MRMDSYSLWEAIITHQGQTFCTSGRGTRPGVSFTYTVKPAGGTTGQHYVGESVPGWSNEMVVDRRGKTITRATVDLALATTKQLQAEQGVDSPLVTGPKKLGVFGASYLYPIFLELGIIRKT